MRGKPITEKEIRMIASLRSTGHSLPEIMAATKRGSSTVFQYAKDIEILPVYSSALKIKQGGSKKRADAAWKHARAQAKNIINNPLSRRERLILLSGIYWGEGNKKELNLINSDPGLIKTFVLCLHDIGITAERIKVGLRLHRGLNIQNAINYWSKLLDTDPKAITAIELIDGKKKGKLQYGMCRIRVAKCAPYFKLVMSLIQEIRDRFNAPVVQRIE